MERYIFQSDKFASFKMDGMKYFFRIDNGEWHRPKRYNDLCSLSTFSEFRDGFEFLKTCHIGTFLETGQKFLTGNADLQLVWYAIQDHKKMAYLPHTKVSKYNGTDAYLEKHGKMLSYGKFCDKFSTEWFPQPCANDLSIEKEIVDVYNDDSKIDSCMSGADDLVDFYEEMDCSILVARDCDGNVTGRAVIWHNPILVSGEKNYPALLDRCYAVDERIKTKMRQFATDRGWDVRNSDEPYFSSFRSGNRYNIACCRDNNIPWLDTLKFYQDGFINNFSGKSMQNTEGSTVNSLVCSHCGNEIDEDEVNYIDDSPYCNDCVVYSVHYGECILQDDAVYCECIGDWISEDDESFECVNGNMYPVNDGVIVYDELDECYIMTDDSVWCDSETITTHRDNAHLCDECGEWFTDKLEEIDGKSLCPECLKSVEVLETVNEDAI